MRERGAHTRKCMAMRRTPGQQSRTRVPVKQRFVDRFLDTRLFVRDTAGVGSATATALDHAVASGEAYGEVPLEEKGPSQSFILQFFVTKGAGENIFTIVGMLSTFA